jgi:hypothetical protein
MKQLNNTAKTEIKIKQWIQLLQDNLLKAQVWVSNSQLLHAVAPI